LNGCNPRESRRNRSAASFGSDQNDIEETRRQKALLVSGSLMFTLAGLLWGILYFALCQFLAGSVAIFYSLISLLLIAIFAVTQRGRTVLISSNISMADAFAIL
jgi:hypothetical protein